MARNRKPKSSRKTKSKKPNKSTQPKERNYKRGFAEKSSQDSGSSKVRPPNKELLAKLLHGIGTPKPTPFVPDDFQIEALESIETHDVLVTAPTGSGKTWIAREEIRRLLKAGRRAWYTTPLKALTNSKYAEFSEEFGADNVGILTGDRKENARAELDARHHNILIELLTQYWNSQPKVR